MNDSSGNDLSSRLLSSAVSGRNLVGDFKRLQIESQRQASFHDALQEASSISKDARNTILHDPDLRSELESARTRLTSERNFLSNKDNQVLITGDAAKGKQVSAVNKTWKTFIEALSVLGQANLDKLGKLLLIPAPTTQVEAD